MLRSEMEATGTTALTANVRSDDRAGAGFDYQALDAATAGEARAAVARYRSRQEAYVLDTGRDLVAMKARLEHGTFLRWVEAEMGLTPRTAQNFMQAATRLGPKSEIVSHLPPTTLYRLSADAVPEPLREEIVGRLAAGEALTAKAIDRRLWEVRLETQQANRDAKLTPEARKRQARLKRDAEARRRREVEKWQAEQDERAVRRKAAAVELAAILSPLLDDDAYDRVYNLTHDASPADLRDALSDVRGRAAAVEAEPARSDDPSHG
ncbi:DUF3102 domain-containing protein [Methylobacterium sp. WL122]|nr:DUF3102 domain-containing protein [Methylobacterium sp. WL122]